MEDSFLTLNKIKTTKTLFVFSKAHIFKQTNCSVIIVNMRPADNSPTNKLFNRYFSIEYISFDTSNLFSAEDFNQKIQDKLYPETD